MTFWLGLNEDALGTVAEKFADDSVKVAVSVTNVTFLELVLAGVTVDIVEEVRTRVDTKEVEFWLAVKPRPIEEVPNTMLGSIEEFKGSLEVSNEVTEADPTVLLVRGLVCVKGSVVVEVGTWVVPSERLPESVELLGLSSVTVTVDDTPVAEVEFEKNEEAAEPVTVSVTVDLIVALTVVRERVL